MVVAPVADIDRRIEVSCKAWRGWTRGWDTPGGTASRSSAAPSRSKLSCTRPTGAIAAAATTSLPEGIGGKKTTTTATPGSGTPGYVIKAFCGSGPTRGQRRADLAFPPLGGAGAQVLYTLNGEPVSDEEELDLPGYRDSDPLRTGNAASGQHQHGIYGDIFETAARFVADGGMLDLRSGALLARLADECAERWKMKDAASGNSPSSSTTPGSKISCWQALARAVEMADDGHLPGNCRDRWARARDRVATWIGRALLVGRRQNYVMYPGSDKLDASWPWPSGSSSATPTPAGDLRGHRPRSRSGPVPLPVHRGRAEEGCFLACTFWLVEALALFGRVEEGAAKFEAVVAALDRNSGTYSEMADPATGAFLGNLPQGLTHLALIQSAATLSGMDL